MKKIFTLFFILLMGAQAVFAYDLVLPKEKKSIINSNYAFFVGKAKKSEIITINNENVYIASNGAFAHSVKLKNGENRIIVKSNFNTQVYKFYKNETKQVVKPELVEFEAKNFRVKKDNTPMRSTPLDYGMNRISHLYKDTNLLIDGEKGDFYRVFLSKDKSAWIAKEAVQEVVMEISPKFITMNSETFKNASKHTIEFTEKLPYTIDENASEIIFKVYNPLISDNSVYTINIRKPQKYSYNVVSHKGVYIFKVTEFPRTDNQNLDGITITIDAGHGGSENGAIGCLGDKEKDINLKIASELKNILTLMGANVVMTRECDGDISLDDRVKLARESCSDIFLSIHLNSIPDIKMDVHKNRGTSVYYYNQNSKDLAKKVMATVSDKLGTRKEGVKSASFAVIRPTDYVAILLEVAYMTNPIDSLLYTKEDFAAETAKAVADGILEYVTAED